MSLVLDEVSAADCLTVTSKMLAVRS